MTTEAPEPKNKALSVVPVPLDSLFSPQVALFDENRAIARESITTDSDFNDVALDDETGLPSAILSPRQSMQTLVESERPRSTSSIVSPTKYTAQHSGHKKTTSTSTIRSSHNLPFLMGRLDLQNGDETESSNRGSVDGQQKLQEEFARLHKEKEVEVEEKAANGAPGAIDWGVYSSSPDSFSSDNRTLLQDFWGAVISGVYDFKLPQVNLIS